MPIPPTDLAAVRTLITHRRDDGPCADGVASALLCCDALPDLVDVRFLRYNSPEHVELRAEPGMLFVDFTPPAHRVTEFVDAGAIVLDHHEKQRRIVEAFGERGVYVDAPGVSGAMLALTWVWEPTTRCFGGSRHRGAERLARLAGVRDTWLTRHHEWAVACAQAAALRFWPWALLFAGGGLDDVDEKLAIGPVLLARDAERDAATLAGAYRGTFHSIKVVMFEGIHTSDIAEQLGAEADVVLGWRLFEEAGAPKMTVSVRSRGARFSAGDFAAAQPGGGGHAGAAGFTITLGGKEHPTIVLLQLLGEYLRGSAR